MPLIIRNSSHLVSNADHIYHDCDVLMENGHIVSIGQNLTALRGTEVIDARGCAVIPGLINPYTHLYQKHLKGVLPGVPLVPWCNEVLLPGVKALTGQFKKNWRIIDRHIYGRPERGSSLPDPRRQIARDEDFLHASRRRARYDRQWRNCYE